MARIEVKAAVNAQVPGTKVLDWLLSNFKKHPKSAFLTLATLWGGFIILLHFYRTGYLPMLALSDLFGVVLAAAVIGASFLFAMGFVILLPGYVLVQWATLGMGPRNRIYLRDGVKFKLVWKYSSLALCTIAAALMTALFYVAVLAFASEWLNQNSWLVPVVLTGSGLAMVVIWGVADTEAGRPFIVARLRSGFAFFLFQLVCYLFWWVYAALIVLFWADSDGWRLAINLIYLLVVPIFMHVITLAVADKSARTRAVVAVVPVLFFALATSSLTSWQKKIIAHFDLGEISRVNVVLDKIGCDTVNTAWSKRPCVVVQGNAQAFLLADVDLITRIGPLYVIGESGTVKDLEDRRLIRVAIRSENVLGWSRVPTAKPPR